jgi:lysine 2,3-aminomutase
MEVATHFIHPDEISPEPVHHHRPGEKRHCRLRPDAVFKRLQRQGPELVRLFSLLRGAGAELHYIYIPCSPIHGNSVYWSPISKGLAVGNYLRAHLSDRVIPRICTATPIGKMDWHTSGWAVEPVAENENSCGFAALHARILQIGLHPLPTNWRTFGSTRGHHRYPVHGQIGDESLFLGARPPKPADGAAVQMETVDKIMPKILGGEPIAPSIVATGSSTISRVHETRVEIDVACADADLEYIRSDDRITDAVIISPNDAVDSLFEIRRIIRGLENSPHVNAVRLRSLAFNYEPERYTPVVVDTLAGLNRLTMVAPLRLEIETQFLVADELRPAHARLARLLNNQGISVYANTPLLGKINDTPEAIHQLAYSCRQAGIEYHHLYVAGLAVQDHWNRIHPVALYDVVDIATRVRREGSGREVPRYIIRTVLGEVDFGLSSTFVGQDENLSVRLLPYDRSYYTSMQSDFAWPAAVAEDPDGKPVVPVVGLLKTTAFALS